VTDFMIPSEGLDLSLTAGPVAWGKGKWPSTDWRSGTLFWCETIDSVPTLIRVEQPSPDLLSVSGFPSEDQANDWLERSLGWRRAIPTHDDPTIAALAVQFPGMRPYSNGSLAQGVITSIIGQSISVQAAAVTEARVASMFHEGVPNGYRVLYPFPPLEELADATAAQIRTSGVTWRRAEAIVAIARIALDGGLPTDEQARLDPDATMAAIRGLPLVGPWTAASALLWGIGADDAHPTGDVALLRAAKRTYGRPEMTLRDLDKLAEAWRPWRGWAARLLWLSLLGPAPTEP
jgi:3-methyladenine DNA glycosylase/8-oxoguanine DNA glycosylase